MEPERRDLRAMIYYNFRRVLMLEECLKQLVEKFTDTVPSRATVLGGLRNLEGAGRACKMTPTQEDP